MRSIDWRGGESFNVTLVHHDIKPDNLIVLPDGGLRLNDFNDAELIRYNITSSGPCRFRRKKHNGNYQSPEEAWELPLSHAVDLHTLGGVLYFILFGKRPYFDLEPEFAFAYLSKQVFPLLPIGFNIEKSGHPAVTTMLQLIRKLRSANPADRPEASLVIFELDALLEEWQAK
jgi:serine/threonine-protein kinase